MFEKALKIEIVLWYIPDKRAKNTGTNGADILEMFVAVLALISGPTCHFSDK